VGVLAAQAHETGVALVRSGERLLGPVKDIRLVAVEGGALT
jgi:hypothetical protein